MIGILKSPVAMIAAASLPLFAGWGLVSAAKALVEKGEALSNAKWKAELALKEAEAKTAIGAARIAGRAEGETAKAEAEKRAGEALAALRKARNANPGFDAALRADWPPDYFAGVCGQRPGCLPPD